MTVTASDTWEDWWSEPNLFLFKESTGKYYKSISMENVPINEEDVPYTYSFNLSSTLPTGKYKAGVMLVPVDDYDNVPEDYDDVDYEEPISYATITVKKLYAPTNVRATAGTRKATITWTKATGAQKYYIYRSTSKTTDFKYVGKTTYAKYVDKNLKKNKRYYYKIKSVRSTRNLIKSSYSSRVSALVK